jgi:hypothetical protein
MKNIIIPAKCGSACIGQLKIAMNLFREEEITCVFLQIREVPDNYNDMMTMHKNMSRYKFFDESFSIVVSELKQEFGTRLTIKTDYIYGDSPAVFRNYTKHHKADLVIYDKKEWDNAAKENNLHIFRMVSRSGCELMYVYRDNSVPDKVIAVNHNGRLQNVPAPDSVMLQYNIIDSQLNALQEGIANSNKIISKKINKLSRYFLNESLLQKMLHQSECSLILVTNK